jgi:UDP:flavonoid glycosyltransferase YjiC (YdhE family)
MSGHVFPMVAIGAHLQSLGHDVSVLTDEKHHRVAERIDLSFEPLGLAAQATASAGPSALSPLVPLPRLARRYLTGRSDIRSTFVAPLVAQHGALQAVLDREPVDAVLVDMAFTGALPLLTSQRPRPAVLVCGVGPLTVSSADTAPFGMAWIPRPGMDYRGMHSVVRRILFRDIEDALSGALSAVGAQQPPVALLDWPLLADRMLQLTVPAFEYPRSDLPDKVSFVGPVLPGWSPRFELPEWWDEVQRAQTVVHVTQGTFNNVDLDQLIGPSLQALADRDGVVVVATTGRRGDDISFPVPANAFVAEWIPYSILLPRVDVMITNGGYGGVQHALSHGVPVVVAGESADKAEVAARAEYTGVGVNLGTAQPTPAAIAEAVGRAVDCRDAAQRMGSQIAATTPLDTIADVVADEIERSTRVA